MKGSRQATIGIDIGGTKTFYALLDDKFRVMEEIKLRTDAALGEKNFSENLKKSINALLEVAHKHKKHVSAVGAGCAGSVDQKRGTLKSCLNIPFLKGYPLRERLEKLTRAPAFIINDVQAGLYGEFLMGAAVGSRNAIGVFVGTGIGGALIINGELYTGSNGEAGNIGHYLLHTVGPMAGSRREGTLDDIASRTAIAGEAATLASKQWAPNLREEVGTDVAKIKSKHLARAIKKGDKVIEELVRARSKIMGIALSNMVDFLNPDTVVLGGGLVDEMPALIRREVEKGIKENTTSDAGNRLRVVTTKLKEHSITIGSAKMALAQ